jgi:dolichyl-phosphate-mannose-protein mannosyltransferase
MKTRYLALRVLLCLLPFMAFASGEDANLVANPGFESGPGKGLPPSWRSDEWNPGLTQFTQESDAAFEGSRYLRIESLDEDDAKLIQAVKVDADSYYRISVMARAKTTRPDRKGAYISVLNIFEGSNEARDTNGEWTELSFYGKTAKGQKSIDLCLRLGGYSSLNSGRADFDLIRVEKLARLPAGAKAVALKAAPAQSAQSSGVPGSEPLTVFLFLLAFCALAYFLDRSPLASALDSGNYARLALFFILGAGLALRLPYCFGGYGYATDLNSFKAWADQAVKSRIVFFYRDAQFADYPPGYVYALAVLGSLRSLFSLAPDSRAYEFIIRIPALACDLGIALLIYRIVKKRSGEARGLLACALFIFTPLGIMDSAIWGQVDSVFCLAIIASLAFLDDEKPIRAGVLYAVAALIKPQAFIFAPVFLCSYVSRRKLKPALLSVLAGIGTLIAGFLPFLFVHGPLFPIDLYSGTLSSYPYATLNAANFWGAIGLNVQQISTVVMGLKISAWGNLAIVAIAGLSVLFFYLLKKKSAAGRDPVYETAVFLILGVFCFSVKMHERYLYPVFPILLCAWSGRKSLRTVWLAVFASLLGFLNVSLIYRSSKAGIYHIAPLDPYFIALSVLNCLSFLAFILLGRAESAFLMNARESSTPGIFERRILDAGRFAQIGDKSDADGKRNRIIALTAITAICLGMALVNLGDLKVPGRGWKPEKIDEALTLDLGSERRVDAISWYAGIGEGEFNLRLSSDAVTWTEPVSFKPELYSWKNKEVKASARYLEIRPKSLGGRLLELAAWSDGEDKPLPARTLSGPDTLVDEQALAKRYGRYTDSMVFDEIYHGRTAYEHLHALEPYEWTHPPLGKLIIALGIEIFGMGPFGWRIMTALFGVLLVPAFYGLARVAFPKGNLALGAALIYAMDFMRLTESRLALVDVYVVLFVIASYVFMWRYYVSALSPDKPDYLSLFLSGLFFSLGAATKWNAVYSGAGLAIVFFIAFIYRLKRDVKAKKEGALLGALGVFGLCVLCFIILPLSVYIASYIPTLFVRGHTWISIWNYQGRMFTYHSTLKAEHPFASSWWEWPWLIKPVWYFKGEGIASGWASTIVAHGNPLIWWPSLVSAIAAAFIALKRRDARILPAILGFFAQYLPWVFVPRLTFLYHYFPLIPFSLICTVYCVQAIIRTKDPPIFAGLSARFPRLAAWLSPDSWIWIYFAACAVLFIWFFPALTGIRAPAIWIQTLRWFPSWFF